MPVSALGMSPPSCQLSSGTLVPLPKKAPVFINGSQKLQKQSDEKYNLKSLRRRFLVLLATSIKQEDDFLLLK